MKILVCVKQVPDMDVVIELDTTSKWLAADQSIDYHINRFDEFAIEEALQIKSKSPDSVVHVLSVGPDRVKTAIQRAMGMGADHGIHVNDTREGLIDPRHIASFIAHYAREKKYDLILTGIMAEDTMQCIVGPLVAAYLEISCATSALNIDVSERNLSVTCELEGGTKQIVQLTMPSLVTVQSGINQPRYPSLSNIIRTKKQPIECVGFFPPNVTLYETVGLRPPSKPEKTVFIEGTPEIKAEKLVHFLHKKGVLK